MLIGISGTLSSGKTEVVRYLTFQGFIYIDYVESRYDTKSSDVTPEITFKTLQDLNDYVTLNWRDNFVISHIKDIEVLNQLNKRPFFLHISIDAPSNLRYKRYLIKYSKEEENGSEKEKEQHIPIKFHKFIDISDDSLYNKTNPLIQINNQSTIKIINTSSLLPELYIQLSSLNLCDPTRLRPNWDSYFMRLADLAALRSNCMKRRVGCVIIRDNRVIATGYNGTPRNLKNCNDGGCPRCNAGNGSGANLSTCLCLHAEENALLESGRDRIGSNGVLYCNTCPCLTCSIKIVQAGIQEVVYSQSYSMDEFSLNVLTEAGIKLRQFIPTKEGVFV